MQNILDWIDRALGEDRDVLVATDDDGTLTEIAERPDAALLDPRTSQTLAALASARGVHVAILSGRTLADVAPRVAHLGPIWLASDHGSVVIDPHHRARVFETEVPADRVEAMRSRAADLARVFRGAHVELKARGVALHYRNVPASKHAALVDMFRLACAAQQAQPLLGRKVVEARFGRGDKGTALAYILSRLPRGTALIYVGDDASDDPALAYAFNEPLGLALHVQSHERPEPRAPVHGWLAGPSEWLEILESLAALRARLTKRAPPAGG